MPPVRRSKNNKQSTPQKQERQLPITPPSSTEKATKSIFNQNNPFENIEQDLSLVNLTKLQQETNDKFYRTLEPWKLKTEQDTSNTLLKRVTPEPTIPDSLPPVGEKEGAFLYLLNTAKKITGDDAIKINYQTAVEGLKKFCRVLLQIIADNNANWIIKPGNILYQTATILTTPFPTINDHWDEFPGEAITQTKDANKASVELQNNLLPLLRWYQDIQQVYTKTHHIVQMTYGFCLHNREKLKDLHYLPRGGYNKESAKSIESGYMIYKSLLDSQSQETFFFEFQELLPSIQDMYNLDNQGHKIEYNPKGQFWSDFGGM